MNSRSAIPGRLRLLVIGQVLIIGLLMIFGVNVSTAFAQQAMTSATLGGRIEDTSGAASSGATVTVVNLETNLTRSVASDEAGRYRFFELDLPLRLGIAL
jgi:hypothetical protein